MKINAALRVLQTTKLQLAASRKRNVRRTGCEEVAAFRRRRIGSEECGSAW